MQHHGFLPRNYPRNNAFADFCSSDTIQFNRPASAAESHAEPASSRLKTNRLLSAPNMRFKMVGRGGIIAALLIYLGISVGCVIFAPSESKTEVQQRTARTQHIGARPTRLAGLPFRGVAMQLQRVDFMDNEYQK